MSLTLGLCLAPCRNVQPWVEAPDGGFKPKKEFMVLGPSMPPQLQELVKQCLQPRAKGRPDFTVIGEQIKVGARAED